MERPTFHSLLAASLVTGLFLSLQTSAHHGWGWAMDEEFQLTGTIIGVRLGNPHGEVTIESVGERWLIEVGQPWRNMRAGLSDDLLQEGTLVTVHGHRSAREGERVMKAERVVIHGKEYVLYPDRES
ncbi:MAG: DUF6152 family protein [Marinobacter sp.]|nr:DUF6152 family protein [Marinobacter sp.]